jgi:hypothetical protein
MRKLIGIALVLMCAASATMLVAQEPVWNPRNIKPCDRACLVGVMESYMTFGIRGGLIHEVEVFPFVTQPYGLVDGWTPGSGR